MRVYLTYQTLTTGIPRILRIPHWNDELIRIFWKSYLAMLGHTEWSAAGTYFNAFQDYSMSFVGIDTRWTGSRSTPGNCEGSQKKEFASHVKSNARTCVPYAERSFFTRLGEKEN